MQIEFLGATQEVTGSCYLLHVGEYRILVECGLIQGSHEHERHNHEAFPFDIESIDAVVLSHAHLDHSGRLPLLVKRGYTGPIYTHRATIDLCSIMLEDAGYLNEKEVQWQNKRREKSGQPLLDPLYTRHDARITCRHFEPLEYSDQKEILPGIKVTLHDAGHILGSAIVELGLDEGRSGNSHHQRTIVFSGDLGHRGAPILRDPDAVKHADLVVMESTYGDRLHRGWDETWQEMGDIISSAHSKRGNILIPAFTIGRTQELLYTFGQNYADWGLGNWQIFLDSPMGISATEVYARHTGLYDTDARQILSQTGQIFDLPNLNLSRDTEYSMRINDISSGAIIIAGSGMCTGGRIKHHLKYNIGKEQAHVLIVGFQARGTTGRALVDGAENIIMWGENFPVRAQIHTIGGLSAHADQQGLLDWYGNFENKPPVTLVHGEPDAMEVLSDKMSNRFGAQISLAVYRQKMVI